jgi:DNA-binding NarL/FixJ family response regulator
LLEQQPNIEVVAEADNGRTAVQLVRELSPDVVIMDVAMPDLDGIGATRQIIAEVPGVKVVALSMHSDRQFMVEMLKAGASGYLLKDRAFYLLVKALREVAAGRCYFDPSLPKDTIKAYMEATETPVKDDANLFLSALLHELSNTIVPVGELVRLSKQSKNPQKYLDMIESHVNRTIQILQRLRTPLASWQLQATDLLEVVSSAREQIVVPDDIRIEFDIPEEARMLKGNPQALLGVFVNLMLNAVQAMEGGGVLVLKSEVVEDAWIEIRVIDTGCGIPVKQQTRLFEPFFTTKEGGQGLGLWLSKQLIRRFGGELVLEKSMLGEGTTFVIRLPLADSGMLKMALTPRQREVLQLIVEGHSTREIASKLQVSVKTVEAHRRHTMAKLDIDSVVELTKYAIREGLTSLES